MIKQIFVWDLGATKCTAGIIEYHISTQALICKKQVSVKLAETISLTDLTEQLETKLNHRIAETDAVCIGAAGHYDGEYLLLAGAYPYAMPFAHIAASQQWPSYAIIHDYASIVCSTFIANRIPQNIKPLNTQTMAAYGRRVALGIGTGLGLKDGVLFPNGDFWLGKNEMGHIGVTLPPSASSFELKRHSEFIHFLQHQNGFITQQPLTFEKILSGPGTARLYQFFYPQATFLTPEQVGMEMRTGKPTEMLDAFAWYLGLFVGTVQLSFMPEGGVWITGGVALNHLDIFDRASFFSGIQLSPAYREQRETYPLNLLCHPEYALLGAGYYAAKRLL